MEYETIRWSFEDHIAEITMDRGGSVTALNVRMCDELFDAACRSEAEGARGHTLWHWQNIQCRWRSG